MLASRFSPRVPVLATAAKRSRSLATAAMKWDDPLLIESSLLTEDERMIMHNARSYCQVSTGSYLAHARSPPPPFLLRTPTNQVVPVFIAFYCCTVVVVFPRSPARGLPAQQSRVQRCQQVTLVYG